MANRKYQDIGLVREIQKALPDGTNFLRQIVLKIPETEFMEYIQAQTL